MYSPELPPLHDMDQEFKLGKNDHGHEEDKVKKRQVRLLKNRQSAALSRHRKKEYITSLEGKAQELHLVTHELRQTVNQMTRQQFDTTTHIEELDSMYRKLSVHNDLLQQRIDEIMTIISEKNSTPTFSPSSSSKPSTHYSRPHEIIIGMNKMNHCINKQQQQQQQQQTTSTSSTSSSSSSSSSSPSIQKVPTNNSDSSTDNNKNRSSNDSVSKSNNQPFLSISNPNVNSSSPSYLTRARSSSYHPTPHDNHPGLAESPSTSSTMLPSLHHLTHHIDDSAAAPQHNVRPSLTASSIIDHKKNLQPSVY
ncbi:hypothetical protein SAMD00019534_000110 [Acytostelium subglobosum LB1]|uniref:hypothetical protein n=1 Tax=Acytostelium subglobosum LB1 TaxID=1410327 RepID=UPI000644D8E0|nr:hypothetical protein SAMD00019534_000110 [Acytostelium subglobosum LB1]GAM16836.1 hypothetical protein SAMD00019534_000110 [Acytostelium subglobosum LB1]|eukprot:XP_012758898.1 hypothetical protein SAMD00019534_000110 [Acytostelium subglobosum LB1]